MQTASRRVALLGGSFNPVHNGHLHIAKEVHASLGYEQILFIPAMIPVHKMPDHRTAPEHRLAMLKIAVEGIPYAVIDECEIIRGGRSYSIDTVNHVYQTYQLSGKPGLIIGDDLIEGFGSWRNVDELAGKVNLIVAKRISEKKLEFRYPHEYLDNERAAVSSSEIRRLVRAGADVKDYVPGPVAAYISRHKLYSREIH